MIKKGISILVADDHPMIRKGAMEIYSQLPEVTSIYEAENGVDALEIILHHPIDILLVDLEMPIMDGFTLLKLIRNDTEIKKIVFSLNVDHSTIRRCMEFAIDGYMLKDDSIHEVTRAIRMVQQGQEFYTPKAMKCLMELERENLLSVTEPLTDQEVDILVLLCRQQSNSDIAKELGISVNTVKVHRRNIMHKTGAHNLAGLVFYAVDRGLFNFRKYRNEFYNR